MRTTTQGTSARTGAEILIEVLREENTRHVFGNPGTTELPLIRNLVGRTDIEYVLGLQEASVVAMADGYARVTGRPAFVNLHAAAGLGNGIGALTNAMAAGVPMVVTAGQQDLRHLFHRPVLAGDLVGLAGPTVKWAHEVTGRHELGEALRRAFLLAQAPPAGPVFLSLPMNLLDEPGPEAPGATRVRFASAAPVEELAARLAATPRAQTALVLCDELARQAPEEGLALAETLGVAVWGSAWPATNPFPTAHPLWRGYLPAHTTGIREALAPYRLVLVTGSGALRRYFPYAPGPLLPEGTRIVQITEDPAEPGRDAPAEEVLHGQLRPTLRRLLDLLSASASTPAGPPLPRRVTVPTPSEGFDMAAMSQAVAKALPRDVLVMDESPQASRHLRAALRLDRAGRYQWVSGGLGWAMPAAIGACLAGEREPVLCAVGDGAAMYSPQALWTAAHLRLPIGFLVANNREYGILKDNWPVHRPGSERFLGLDLSRPPIDYVSLADSMGVPARRVTDAATLSTAIEDGLATGGPFLVEAVLDARPDA
ncbi:thiamine pyrophosphate-binding protein (plasmid) [Streptomyces sp. BI20]|uniref:thiamine pyrophosphate-binding protein n=1 Tax=Streptomyces sp. BI20 TaxID=3403460 RepID=UPI003C747B65